MGEKWSITTLNQLFLEEKVLVEARDKTPAAVELKQSRGELTAQLREIGKSGDLDLIMAAERRFLENDLAQYVTSGAMRNSLKTALKELEDARAVLPLVKDSSIYQAIDRSHAHHKSRVGGLPKDAARQFFTSNAARLLNMDKSRLDAEEKGIVDARKQNMRAADGLYAGLQRQALGLAPTPDRDHGLAR
ncbi:MAG: hypothetical protein EPN20_18820 [Magnetospirillum sp.]|nr:MAG: hypothetical protein EPN20_18820 [Magnetospirillum sp.]